MVQRAASLGHSQVALHPPDGGYVYAGTRAASQLRYSLGCREAPLGLHRAQVQEAQPVHVVGLCVRRAGTRYAHRYTTIIFYANILQGLGYYGKKNAGKTWMAKAMPPTSCHSLPAILAMAWLLCRLTLLRILWMTLSVRWLGLA